MSTMATKPATRVERAALAGKVLVKDSVLTLECTLQRADYNAFQEGCALLAKSRTPVVTMDLTRCTYVSSLFIGMLVDAVTSMKAQGKNVSVRVSPQVGRFLHMAHLYHLFEYSIVEPAEEA
jgi:anti-anti-sigma regulatory factor